MNLLDRAKKDKTTTKPTAKKTGVPVIEAPDENVAEAVDKVRLAITAKKQAEAELLQYGDLVIDFFLTKKEEEARAMNFRKSFKINGRELDEQNESKHQVMVKHANKALKINFDDLDTIQDILTEEEFKMLLEQKTALTVKSEVLIPNSALSAKLWKMLGDDDDERDENFGLFFEAKNSLAIKPDFDRNIFRLGMKAFNALAVYVKMIRPGLQ